MTRSPLRRLGVCSAALLVVAATVLSGPSTASAAAKCKAESRTGEMTSVPWPLKRLQPERVWPLTRGEGIKVAVIDSGVGEHPLLDGQVTAVDMAGDKLGARCDMASHGTIVAGIIAAKDTESSPFHGLAPDSKILSYRVIQSMERSTSEESTAPVVNAIRLAVQDGAKVINLSLTAIATPALESAIKYAHENNVVVVAAAGNSGITGQKEYPAAYESVIAVAGLSAGGTHVDTSSVRNYVDVAAPGEQIDGPAPAGGGFGRLVDGGTSFAAPYVSATAALLMSHYPDMKPDEVARRITATAVHPPGGWNPVVGYGEVDPYRAVTAVLSEVDERTAPAAAAPDLPGDPGKSMRERALLVTGAAGLAMVLLLIVRFVVPLGRRRKWRAG
ncbi:type VII secretion-associated serine protease mycosin [Phytomonospora sp. NPDC050363]|uniref:type VII secretion-associated serine protease mycosin n=1 Tax=Phytomonospora sp. NPDC050363 TaxID=3155642 RepID=UPI0033CD9A7F